MSDKDKSKELDLSFSDTEMMMMMALPMVMMMMASMMQGQLAPVSQALAAQSYSGINDPRIVNATHLVTWLDFINDKPYQPWMLAFIINEGPDPVYVAINYPGESFRIDPGGTRTISRTGAQERIGVLFFTCDHGQRATLSVTGEY